MQAMDSIEVIIVTLKLIIIIILIVHRSSAYLIGK